MNNKNLLIGLGVAVLVYYFYNKNQKEKIQATPYTDAELDKVAFDFVTEERKRALEVNPKGNIEDVDKAKRSVLDLIQRAKTNGKDLSRANVDKMLNIFRKMQRSQMGDNSAGTATPEEESMLYDFMGIKRPVESNMPSSPIGEKKDLGNGLSVVYDIANCNKTTKKCPIMRVIKQDGDTFTSWYSENNKYFKRIESPLAPKGGNVTEIREQQYIDEAMSIIPF
jgi:hypothetical protein